MFIKNHPYVRYLQFMPPSEKIKLLGGILITSFGIYKLNSKIKIKLFSPLFFFLGDTFCPQLNLIKKSFWKGNTQKYIALTFDDGPDFYLTPKVLAILNKFKIKATFFQLVKKSKNNKNLVKEIIREGHEIGLHGLTHKKVCFMKNKTFEEEIKLGKYFLEDLTGVEVRWYRPPHGFIRFDQLKVLKKYNLKLAGWTIGIWDTSQNFNSFKVLPKLKKYVKSGDILLFHDGKEDKVPYKNLQLLLILEKALPVFKRNFCVVTLSKLWKISKESIKNKSTKIVGQTYEK